MAKRLIVALISLAAAAPVATAWADDSSELRRLRAENERLRAELNEARSRVQKLQQQLEDARAAMRQLQARVDQAAKAEPAGAGQPKAPLAHKLSIRVQPGAWGGAGPGDIQKVLLSAAGELWKHFPDRKLAPILVQHSDRGPITLYRRGPGGEHIIKIDVEGAYWCQFAYQFAHEFCHVLTNYSERARHKWFAESLCEAASMYAVRRMSESWKTAAPYPHWKGYSSALAKYAADLRKKPSDEPAEGEAFADWFAGNEAGLARNAYMRDKNRLVAKRVVALLEEDPANWRAVGYLNVGEDGDDRSFAAYLAVWCDAVPDAHKPFVQDVIKLFGCERKSKP